METITVRNQTIGSGKPKVIVPIVQATPEGIEAAAKTIKESPVDLVEWRVDWFEAFADLERVKAVAKQLRQALEDIPLLATFRTKAEGGEQGLDSAAYEKLNRTLIQSGAIDLIDIELFSGEDIVRSLVECAHQNDVKVVASSHDFKQTPSNEDMESRLRTMRDLGADVLKLAVMPNTEDDVVRLLATTRKLANEKEMKPLVTMAMGETGKISRVTGELFGSTMTFGCVGQASAPGQIPIETLHSLLDVVHESLEDC